ncbi:MAG: tryptophan--tRNA ligase [Verrucomicrobia bacterium]|nr:tryptophan--tRNA ligase [Verrucomicrobiota bacterium]
MRRKILLTGDRPTGPLHLGHYVGSLKNRIAMQGETDLYVMIADAQAITDNFKDIQKVRTNILEVACDYLAVGLDPEKCHIFIQSCLSELPELTMYFLNLVSIQQIGHNPTVKAECKMRGFDESVPAGFYLYPIFQVADILAFQADIVPVGPDQTPMLELTRDVARKFNDLYKTKLFPTPQGVYPKMEKVLAGFDGQKMSKSLGNAIYLSDPETEVIKKVKKMKSDETRGSIKDPGDPEKAIAFSYLDSFDPDHSFVANLKEKYKEGGLPDSVIKERLIEVLLAFLKPIREKREVFHKDPEAVFSILERGTEKAKEKASQTLAQVKEAMGIRYSFIYK